MKKDHMIIDVSLVRRLIDSQFPQWKELANEPARDRYNTSELKYQKILKWLAYL